MFQIHIIDASNRAAYESEIEQHFRIRHDIYVGERRWQELARPDEREIDAFDTDDAIYLLGLAPDGKVVAGSRVIPSLKPHLMSEVFPELAGGRVPREENIFEWTRFFVVPQLRKRGQPCRAAGIVYCGILEFCLRSRIHNLTIVCEAYWAGRFAALGWNPRPLGPPFDHRGETLLGLLVDTGQSALATTRSVYGVSSSVLAINAEVDAAHVKIDAPAIHR